MTIDYMEHGKPEDSLDALAELDVPAQLHASVERHRKNLARLVMNLQSAGFGPSQIEASVNTVIASYKSELLIAINSMIRGDHG